MTYYLPSSSKLDTERLAEVRPAPATCHDMADLKVFWGAEICRIEYLIHLLNTGRVKDEHWPRSA